MNEILRGVLFLPEQGSTVASDVDSLHYFVILTTFAGAIAVTLIGAYLLYRYRRSSYGGTEADEYTDIRRAEPPKIPFKLEVAVVVGLLGLFLLWWVIGFRQYVRLRISPESSEDVYVTGKKWMWKFAYPDGSASVGVLYVPAGEPVRLIMTSRDVIHSFYVPDFRVKQDVVPGRYTTMWFNAKRPGVYPVFCAEYCGSGHSRMRAQVVALGPEEYAAWLDGPHERPVAGQDYKEPAVVFDDPREQLDLVAMGEVKAAQHGCMRCHSIDGTPHIGPSFAGLYGSEVKLTGGGAITADEAYITESMMDPQKRARVGFKPIMPSYLGIPAGDTAAIVEYIKSLRDVAVEPRQQKAYP